MIDHMISICTCWIVLGASTELLRIRLTDDPGYDTTNLTRCGLKFMIRIGTNLSSFEYLIAIVLYLLVYAWKVIRVPIRIMGLICTKLLPKKDDDIDEVNL